MFATRRGTPIERTEDRREWKTILKQAGVRDVRVHDTRHTRVITTERYTHVAAAQVQYAGTRMASALWGED